MLNPDDVMNYTVDKQQLQVIMEHLFIKAMERFDLPAFLADPRGYTRAFISTAAARAIRAVAPEAQKIGQAFAEKAGGGSM